MHNPERDPFYEGLWADIQEGIEAADRGDLFDLEDVARVRVTGPARRDLGAIRSYIGEDSPGASV